MIIWGYRNFWEHAALFAHAAPRTRTPNHGHSILNNLDTGKCVVSVLCPCTHSLFYSLPVATCQVYDKAIRELQVHDALQSYKKANPEKDFVAVALDSLLAPESCPNCKSSYDVCPVFYTALRSTFIAPCTLPCVAQSSHCLA